MFNLLHMSMLDCITIAMDSRYVAFAYSTLLNTVRQPESYNFEDFELRINTYNPHLHVSYGCLLWVVWRKSDHEISKVHCTEFRWGYLWECGSCYREYCGTSARDSLEISASVGICSLQSTRQCVNKRANNLQTIYFDTFFRQEMCVS